MRWAEDPALNQYPEHGVIVFTHSYLHTNGQRVTEDTRWSPKGYGATSTETGPEYNPRANTVTVENLMPLIGKDGEAPLPESFVFAKD